MAGETLHVRTRGEGPYELVLSAQCAGVQRFAEPTLEALGRAIGGFAPFRASRRADMPEVLVVIGARELVRHSDALDVQAVTGAISPEEFHARKVTRQAALELAWAGFATPERLEVLLRGRAVHTQDRPSLAWLRATPPSEWPPILVRWNGEHALLTGGCHRVRVARELGIRQVRAQVHAGGSVVFEGLVGV